MARYIDSEKLMQEIVNNPLKALEGREYEKVLYDIATDIVHETLDRIDEQPTTEYVIEK